MPRDIHASTLAELSAPKLSPIYLIELEFGSGVFRMWTGWGELIWGITEGILSFTDGTVFSDTTEFTDAVAGGATQIWYGAGNLGRIGAVEESIETRAIGLEMTISAIPPEVLAIALAEDWQNRPARVYFAVLNDQGQLLGEPFQIFGGIMDRMQLSEGQEASITLSCESDEIDFERPNVRRYTAEDQRSEHPGDAGFDQVTALQEIEIVWNVA